MKSILQKTVWDNDWIKNRIISENHKHHNADWAGYAAIKIMSTLKAKLDERLAEVTIVPDDLAELRKWLDIDK